MLGSVTILATDNITAKVLVGNIRASSSVVVSTRQAFPAYFAEAEGVV
jgi:hypothetical protein